MDDIVQQLVQRVGIPEDKARMALQVIAGHLEKHLPGPVASQVKAYLSGGEGGPTAAGALGDVQKGLGGMFGNK